MSPDRQWTAAQRQAFTERRAELAVSAAAGSGKTAVLIERVLRLALGISTDSTGRDTTDAAQRVSLANVLVVTFTRAAAAELRERLRRALQDEARRPAGERRAPLKVIREQLAALPRAQFSTIHSFCGEVVRRYGHQAGLSPGRVIDDAEAALLRHELATRFLDERLGPDAGPQRRDMALAWGGSDGVGPEDLARVRRAGGLRSLLLGLLEFRRTQPDPERWFAEYGLAPPLDPRHCDPQHPRIAAVAAELATWVEWAVEQDTLTGEIMGNASEARFHDILQYRLACYRRISLAGGWDSAAAALGELTAQLPFRKGWTYLTGYRNDLRDYPDLYDTVPSRNDPIKRGVEGWLDRFTESWAEVARRENAVRPWLAELWLLTAEFDAHYTAYKRERGIADFDDLQRDALSVLAATTPEGGLAYGADGRVLPSAAGLELRHRFAQVLVDEHQDTNELQDTLLDLVTRDAPAGPDGGGRPRFYVGDLKQSIYTFRQAVPQLFAATRQHLDSLPDDAGQSIRLQQNFRSRPLLLTAINRIFDGVLTEDLGGEDYRDNRLLAPDPAATPPDPPPDGAGHPAELHLVLTTAADAPEDEQDNSGEDDSAMNGEEESPTRLEQGYASLARVLSGIHADGDPVRDGAGWRPVQWRDMVVLLRSTTGRIETLLRVFSRQGIPAYAPGRSGFYERPEVTDALSLLRVADNPRQDIPLAAVLSGPALGLSDAELLKVAQCGLEVGPHSGPTPDLWERLLTYLQRGADVGLRDRLAAFCGQLDGWRDLARQVPVADLLWRMYADSGLPAAVAGLPGGTQRVANLELLHELARRSAGTEHQGLGRFLRSLELSRRAAGDLGEAPVLTAAQDVVRVLTVHQSKGLEFPLVAVPGLDKRFNLQDLTGDVLWHRRAGLGGRLVEWHGPADPAADYLPPQRCETLSRRQAREARRRDAVAEELRILYVALTRARDRLVLVSTVDEPGLQRLSTGRPPAEASCWLDWIGSQLQDGIAAARELGAPAGCGPDGSWLVSIGPADALDTAAPPAAVTPLELNEADRELIRKRLAPPTGYTGSAALPAKLSVTRLAHRLRDDDDADRPADSAPLTERSLAASPVAPAFLHAAVNRRAGPATAAEIGSAVHLVLAELDWRADIDAAGVARVCDGLVATGRLEPRLAAVVDPPVLARAVAAVRAALVPDGAQVFSELPLALLVPGRDAELLSQLRAATGQAPDPAAVHPDDAVYVQGVADLLVVGAGLATVVDFKTDRGADAATLVQRYKAQLGWYCRMVGALLPEHRLRWALYGLDGAGLVTEPE